MSSSTQQPERLVRMMVMMMAKLNTIHNMCALFGAIFVLVVFGTILF
ncbi:hypothetical protein XIS1_600076 [Xenorhabdus innexi]|uniref:Uncharacterized protein n=1 Tax=Xenorhabdus innexi TaxID=290109 RepID=A0A1N6MZT2_9GAMM|nr:hypothetical protein XIS1_600076 [Xenorhabdus innexi]